MYKFMNPIDVSINNGDWDTLICYLNCISAVKPENRPILIREIVNFHPDTLQECLRAMEKAKQNVTSKTIILETSDNLWTDVVTIKRSSLSFRPYYIEEMVYKEGERDMVATGYAHQINTK